MDVILVSGGTVSAGGEDGPRPLNAGAVTERTNAATVAYKPLSKWKGFIPPILRKWPDAWWDAFCPFDPKLPNIRGDLLPGLP